MEGWKGGKLEGGRVEGMESWISRWKVGRLS